MLLAPGAPLVGARVSIDQVNLYDGKAEIRKHVGEAVTDAKGYFDGLPTGTINGLILLDAAGGTYVDPLNGAHIQLDASVHLKALHWLGIFEDRESMYVTPIHGLVEARFRYKMGKLKDSFQAMDEAYAQLNAHFGGLDWEKVVPADLDVAVPSPTDEVRAAFILGGLAMLAEDLRAASHATPQVVNLMTLVDAAERDLGNALLDGDDENNPAPGSGLQVGDCPPIASCTTPPGGCALGCRASCDLYANTYRNLAAESIAKFIGPKLSPSTWNHTTLTSDDARAFTDSMSRNKDADLFGDACLEPPRRLPPTILWDNSAPDGSLQGAMLTLHVHAIDGDSNKLPAVSFQGYLDSDGDPANDFATTTVDTREAMKNADGSLTITAVAMGVGGNTSTSTRTFQIDNTAPSITLDSTLYVDQNNVWWTAMPQPTLSGVVTDMHGVTMVQAKVGSAVATAQLTGTQWSVQLPPLPPGGADVAFLAFDEAGNIATRVQTIHPDLLPPVVSVNPSPVFDEGSGDISFEDTPAPIVKHTSSGAPVNLATSGSCPTIHKYAHLLFAPKPDQTHAVLGSVGDLNPVVVNVQVSDDGVGIKPGTTQYQVLLKDGDTFDVLQSWTAMPASGTAYAVGLYRDAIAQLGTTDGEYHVQMRATDQFGRTTTEERCWNHVILAPPLKSTTPSSGGEVATGFKQALWSASLSPAGNQTGDFAEKFLNPDAANQAGLAVWRARFKNYLGMPVYMKVQIPRPPGDLSATVNREFKVVHSLTNSQVGGRQKCANRMPCSLASTEVVHDSDFNAAMIQPGLQFRAHLFVMNGNETDHEFSCAVDDPGPGCVTSSDDTTQTYVFTIPARTAQQGNALPEYGVLTNLLPTLPAGSGTNVTMAPSDGSSPDAGPFGEFTFQGATLTGKMNPGTIFTGACTAEDVGDPERGEDSKSFYCTEHADGVEYRALAQILFQLNSDVITAYSAAAQPSLPYSQFANGVVHPTTINLTTGEPILP